MLDEELVRYRLDELTLKLNALDAKLDDLMIAVSGLKSEARTYAVLWGVIAGFTGTGIGAFASHFIPK